MQVRLRKIAISNNVGDVKPLFEHTTASTLTMPDIPKALINDF
jgi:hypothetical protein